MAPKAQKGGGSQSLSEEPSPSPWAACFLSCLQLKSIHRYTKAHSHNHTGYIHAQPRIPDHTSTPIQGLNSHGASHIHQAAWAQSHNHLQWP